MNIRAIQDISLVALLLVLIVHSFVDIFLVTETPPYSFVLVAIYYALTVLIDRVSSK